MMLSAAIQGHAARRTIEDLRFLIAHGEMAAAGVASLAATGLWMRYDAHIVATPALIALHNRLPKPDETVTAILALEPSLRRAWLGVVQGRLREMGERRDLEALTTAISAAGALAEELGSDVKPALGPTGFAELERLVLPTAAHEGPAFPVLLRALAATAAWNPGSPGAVLPVIVWDDPGSAWRAGRILRLPSVSDLAPTHGVLAGGLDGATAALGNDAMHWVLHRPWAFLLAQMVFTQEAWEAERISGHIAFELEPAHVSVFQHPPQVEVVVTLPNGAEVRCGTLGDYTQRVLAQLGVTVLAHRLNTQRLDEGLSDVVAVLLAREVWRFNPGAGARRPAYVIHPHFSDACYRALGSRAFYRLGSSITAAVRRCAETWAAELLARSGSAGTSA